MDRSKLVFGILLSLLVVELVVLSSNYSSADGVSTQAGVLRSASCDPDPGASCTGYSGYYCCENNDAESDSTNARGGRWTYCQGNNVQSEFTNCRNSAECRISDQWTNENPCN